MKVNLIILLSIFIVSIGYSKDSRIDSLVERYFDFSFLYSHNSDVLEILLEGDKTDTRILRNLIFAKNGYVFKDSSLNNYFCSFKKYNPISKKLKLNIEEEMNLNLIKLVESGNSKKILEILLEYEKCVNGHLCDTSDNGGTISVEVSAKSLSINGKQLGDSWSENNTQFGKPHFITKSKTIYDDEKPDSAVTKWLYDHIYDGALVYTYGTEILSMFICDRDFKTGDGFSVGMPISIVLEKYTELNLLDKQTGCIDLYRTHMAAMTICYENGKIVRIYLSIAY